MNDLKRKYLQPALERNYEKFFTPSWLAEQMVKMVIPLRDDTILEPSAGNGSIVRAIKYYEPDTIIHVCELKEEYRSALLEAGARAIYIGDFLEYPESYKFDHCIANPPFGNETSIKDHYDKICRLVKPGGKIAMIVPYDFHPGRLHEAYPVDNWSTNSDGTTTEIKVIAFIN